MTRLATGFTGLVTGAGTASALEPCKKGANNCFTREWV